MADSEKAVSPVKDQDMDVEDVEDEEEEEGVGNTAASQLLQDPRLLAALQGRLNGMIGDHSGYIESLPKVVKKRIKCLKKLQLEAVKQEAEFHKEVFELENKYHAILKPMYEKREKIINGQYEPNDDECDFPLIAESDEKKDEADQEDVKPANEQKRSYPEGIDDSSKGIPEFWLTTFKNVELIAQLIEDCDLPVLKHLTDVTCHYITGDRLGFRLDFHFSPNDYFTNATLSKSYELRCSPEESDPFAFEGPEICKSEGCKIDWKSGKDVTKKQQKKKQKQKGGKEAKIITKTVDNKSFFKFFNPLQVKEEEYEDLEEEQRNEVTTDFEVGHYIRDRLVPKAVLYFTGEALSEEEYSDAEEDEDEDEEEGDEDPDYVPKNGKNTANNCPQQ